jgi:hypothetical protein
LAAKLFGGFDMSKLKTQLLIASFGVATLSIILVLVASEDSAAGSALEVVDSDTALNNAARLGQMEKRLDELNAVPSSAGSFHNVPDRRALIEALEQRIAALETAPDVAQTDAKEVVDEDHRRGSELEPLSLDDQRDQTIEDWYTRLAVHESETRDPAWAHETSASFDRDLESISAQAGFRFIRSDCKSSTCTATVEFDNYDHALNRFGNLLHHDYEVNCAREVLLPEPTDVETQYHATVLYNCPQS